MRHANLACNLGWNDVFLEQVRVTTVRFNGTTHDFMLLNPIAQTPAVRAAIRRANDMLQGVLHG